jgi:cell division protein FtsX
VHDVVDDSRYVYDREPPASSMGDKFWEWLVDLLSNLTKGGFMGFSTVTIVLFTLVLILIVYLLIKNDTRGLFYGKSASVKIDFSEFEEDIHEIDFDALIEEAERRKDFRKVVRLQFLKLLKQLSDKDLIKWKIDKTNRDYIMELTDHSQKKSFRELARLYEYIWYGDFQTDEQHFREAIAKFKTFRV